MITTQFRYDLESLRPFEVIRSREFDTQLVEVYLAVSCKSEGNPLLELYGIRGNDDAFLSNSSTAK